MIRSAFLALIVAFSLPFFVKTCRAQLPGAGASDFIRSIQAALRVKDFDKALQLAHSPEAEPDEVPRALWIIAQRKFGANQLDDTLALLDEIVDRHSASDYVSLAWLGKAQVYAKQKDDKKMVAALEKGLQAKRVNTHFDVMDASDTRSWAAQTLGNHYLERADWERALATYTAWKPSSWCGNCLQSMESSRHQKTAFCLVKLERHAEAATAAWQGIHDPLARFTLIRIYSEAKQWDDLIALLKRGKLQLDEEDEIALYLATSKKWFSHLRQFDTVEVNAYAEYEFSLTQHVASWRLLSNEAALPDIIAAARVRPESHFTKLLAAVDSPDSRQALVDLAVNAEKADHAFVHGVIRARTKNPNELVQQVSDRLAKMGKRAGYRPLTPAPIEYNFYCEWPRAKPGTLPKTLNTTKRDNK